MAGHEEAAHRPRHGLERGQVGPHAVAAHGEALAERVLPHRGAAAGAGLHQVRPVRAAVGPGRAAPGGGADPAGGVPAEEHLGGQGLDGRWHRRRLLGRASDSDHRVSLEREVDGGSIAGESGAEGDQIDGDFQGHFAAR